MDTAPVARQEASWKPGRILCRKVEAIHPKREAAHLRNLDERHKEGCGEFSGLRFNPISITIQSMTWDYIGNEWAVQMLQRHITTGGLRHAYLLCGPYGTGRRTLALRFAQALNCPQPLQAGVPCGSCRTCQQIERMQHADLDVVQAEEGSRAIKVDQVRRLQQTLSLTAYEAPYRVALLLNFEDATPSAQNALLKTLEEAPDQVILILTAQSPEMLLPTITSRCEVLRLQPLACAVLEQVLQERWGIPREEAALLAPLSAGRTGCALRLHQQPEEMEQRGAYLEDAFLLLGMNRRERFAYVENNLNLFGRSTMGGMLETWLSLWRDVFLAGNGSMESLVNVDLRDEILEMSGLVDTETARRCTADLLLGLGRLDANVNPRLLAEVILLDWPLLPGG